MKLVHVCPKCGREHEVDCVPEPSQPCPDCVMGATVVLKLDGGNTRVQKSEIESIVESARREAEKYHIKIDDYTYDR